MTVNCYQVRVNVGLREGWVRSCSDNDIGLKKALVIIVTIFTTDQLSILRFNTVNCKLVNNCSNHGTCTGPNQCTCEETHQSPDCSIGEKMDPRKISMPCFALTPGNIYCCHYHHFFRYFRCIFVNGVKVKNIVILKVVFTLFLSSSLLLLLYISHFHAKFSSFYRPYNHYHHYYIIFVVRCHHG